MKHPWFSDVNWEKVNNLELEVPIKMDIKDKMDTDYFDVTDKSNIKRTRALKFKRY